MWRFSPGEASSSGDVFKFGGGGGGTARILRPLSILPLGPLSPSLSHFSAVPLVPLPCSPPLSAPPARSLRPTHRRQFTPNRAAICSAALAAEAPQRRPASWRAVLAPRMALDSRPWLCWLHPPARRGARLRAKRWLRGRGRGRLTFPARSSAWQARPLSGPSDPFNPSSGSSCGRHRQPRPPQPARPPARRRSPGLPLWLAGRWRQWP